MLNVSLFGFRPTISLSPALLHDPLGSTKVQLSFFLMLILFRKEKKIICR